MTKEVFKIQGMTCASCARTIEKAVSSLAGVISAQVNFGAETLLVEFDEVKISPKDMAKATKDAGYQLLTLELLSETSEAEDVLSQEKKEREKELSGLKKKVIAGAVLSIPIFLGSFPEWFPFVPKILTSFFFLFVLTTPVQFWVGSRFYRGLLLLVKYRTADMNTLIAMGTLSAYLYSSAVTFFPDFFRFLGEEPKIYFDTSAIIITLILFGRYLELMAKGRASEAIKKLMKLSAKTARVVRGNKEQEIPIEEVVVGDIIIFPPPEKNPI